MRSSYIYTLPVVSGDELIVSEVAGFCICYLSLMFLGLTSMLSYLFEYWVYSANAKPKQGSKWQRL